MTLAWKKPDDYHIRTHCGRFSVARMTVCGAIWYVAFRLPGESRPAAELRATKLPATATDGQRQAAIHEMQEVCEAAA